MGLDLVIPPLSPPRQAAVRDLLFDLSQEHSSDSLITLLVNQILDYQSDPNPLSRRRKWCLAMIHSRQELEDHLRARLASFGVTFRQEDGFVTGRDDHVVREATLFEAWFGIWPGLGGIPAEEVDWGDIVEDLSFSREADAARYEQSLERAGTENYTSYHLGSDGKWHILIVRDNPYQ